MTPVEMQVAFHQHYETLIGRPPSLLSEDLFFYLNEAQRKFVEEAFSIFEESQRIVDYIKPLNVKEHVLTARFLQKGYTSSNLIDYAVFPTDHLYQLNQKAEILRLVDNGDFVLDTNYEVNNVMISETGETGIPKRELLNVSISQYARESYNIRFSQSDDILRLLDDPFNNPIYSDPVCTLNENGINVYTNSKFIVDKIIIDYIKTPPEIDPNSIPVQSSLLAPFAHKLIVEAAVNLYLSKLSTLKNDA